MVAMRVLEARVERRVGSSPTWGTKLWKYGWAWLKAAVLKTEGSKGSVGSNPTTSANHACWVATLEHRKTCHCRQMQGPARKSWAIVDSSATVSTFYVSLAQLAEHWSPKPGVGSSRLSRYANVLKCESGEMVYSGDLKSPVERHAGSSPASRTKLAV